MNANCRSFRQMLERALEGGRGTQELTSLAWHEHLLTCGDCRALLESEEALELLLSSLPEPHLPPRLARRVLARLRAGEEAHEEALDRLLELDAQARAPSDLARRVLAKLEDERALPARSAAQEQRLDALLDRSPAPAVPPDLAQRVAAHLAEERALSKRRHAVREAALDRLLERAGKVEEPAGLSQRVLAALSSARQPARRPAELQLLRGGRFSTRRTRVLLAAAASLAIALTLWALWPRHDGRERDGELAQGPDGRVDTRLLENLDVLEEWEILDSGNVDILLSTLPVADQWLLELGNEEGAPAPEKLDKELSPPKKG